MDEKHQRLRFSWLSKDYIHQFLAILWDLSKKYVPNKIQNDMTGMKAEVPRNSFMIFPVLTSSTLARNKDGLRWCSQRSGSLTIPSNTDPSFLGDKDVFVSENENIRDSLVFIFLSTRYYLLFNLFLFFPLYGMDSHMSAFSSSPLKW